MPDSDCLKTGEPQHSLRVDWREPILRQHWRCQAQSLGDGEGELPNSTMKVDDQARSGVAQPANLLESDFDIPNIVYQVGQYDDVKLLVQDREVMGVGLDEIEAGVTSTSAL